MQQQEQDAVVADFGRQGRRRGQEERSRERGATDLPSLAPEMTQFFSTAIVIAVTGPACPAPAAAGSVYHGLAVVGLAPPTGCCAGEPPVGPGGGAGPQSGLPSDACTLCRKPRPQIQSRKRDGVNTALWPSQMDTLLSRDQRMSALGGGGAHPAVALEAAAIPAVVRAGPRRRALEAPLLQDALQLIHLPLVREIRRPVEAELHPVARGGPAVAVVAGAEPRVVEDLYPVARLRLRQQAQRVKLVVRRLDILWGAQHVRFDS